MKCFHYYGRLFPLKKLQKAERHLFAESGGFTLVEILIAMAVMAMVVPAVMGLFIAGNNIMATGKEDTVAVKLAHMQIEEIKGASLYSVGDNGFLSEEIIGDYGDIDGFESYKTVTYVDEMEISVQGELFPVKMYEINVSVYRKVAGNTEEGSAEEEVLSLSHKTLHGF